MRFVIAAATLALAAGAAEAQAPPRPNIDPNNDGKVTLAEFKASRVQREMRADRNRDGKVDAAERKQMMALAANFGGGQGGSQRFEQQWKQTDGNKDGVVTKAEVEAAATQRFRTMDANKDGVLTGKEIPAFGQRRAGAPPRRG